MQRKKILVVDPIYPPALSKLKETYNVCFHLHPEEKEFKVLIGDVDAIILRSGVKLTSEIIDSALNLKLIARAGVGVDNIDLEFAKQKNITIFNVPGISAASVAEHNFGLILAIARKISLADRQLRDNIWNKSELYGTELKGKTLGIIGLGKIGKYLAKIAKGFDMKIIASVENNNPKRKEELKEKGIILMDNDSIFKEADIISLNLPLNDKTKNFITKNELSTMKKTVYLINMARGGVVNEEDLYDALKNKIIAGAATDVFKKEKQRSDLFELDNIVVTPHIGAMTFESQEEIGNRLITNIDDFFIGNPIQNRIC